jgi:hypothetical protein
MEKLFRGELRRIVRIATGAVIFTPVGWSPKEDRLK